MEDLSVVDAVAAVKGELSVEVGSSTEKDGKAAKNAWPGLVSINVLTHVYGIQCCLVLMIFNLTKLEIDDVILNLIKSEIT